MIRRLVKSFTISLCVLIIFSGCSITGDKNQEYFNSANEFNNIYFQIVEQFYTSDTLKSLETLQSEDNRTSIEKLGVLLEKIKQTVPKDRELQYDNFKGRYDDLVFLKESYSRFNELTEEERGKIDRAMVLINYYKINRNDKNSKTVWE